MQKYATIEELKELECKVKGLKNKLDKYSSVVDARFSIKSGIEEVVLNNKVQELIKEVKFDQNFESIPKVMLGLNHIDVTSEDYIRIAVDIITVQEDQFIYKVRTWNMNKVYKVEFNWLAYGS